ncbi:MAG: hypothetical protein DSM106950_28020 [Stigonema ocellatum SAG 48.90 = DSM 106950]|nr:hypothetical protein [Stigonema ocellatum SAG 48.90 = DSM 106950]
MTGYAFHDESTLTETTEKLGKQALKLGLIPSFVVRHYPDSSQYYIPSEKESEPLTSEEAYLRFKKILAQAS